MSALDDCTGQIPMDGSPHLKPDRATPSGVELTRLSLGFYPAGKRNLLQVLDLIDLSVREGEFVAIVGPSGCGKTSILRVAGGLLEATDRNVAMRGEVLVRGMCPRIAKKERMFGFAFQNPVLYLKFHRASAFT